MSSGESHRLMRDAVINNLAAPVSALVGLLVVPMMLTALGHAQYGLWIVAASLMGIILSIDFGLGPSINRIIAANQTRWADDDISFVESVGTLYFLLGAGGCLLLFSAGLFFPGKLHFSHFNPRMVTTVFALFGIIFFFEKISAFAYAVLSGFRRFDVLNRVSIVASLGWVIGVFLIVAVGGSLYSLVAFQLVVAVLKSLSLLWLVAGACPHIRFRPGVVKWSAVHQHLPFVFSSFLLDTMSGISWNYGPMLIGFIMGPAAAVPFYIGQKIPMAISSINWRSAEVLFPAASQNQQNGEKSGEVLRVGLRWILVLVCPFLVFLFIAAPAVLQAWLSHPPHGAVEILRIMSVVVLADAVIAAPLTILWGRGVMKSIVAMSLFLGFSIILLTIILIPFTGIAGAAWGMLLPMIPTAAVLLKIASAEYGLETRQLILETIRGLLLPVFVCSFSIYFILLLLGSGRLPVIVAAMTGLILYGIILIGFTGRSEEKQFIRRMAAKISFLRSLKRSSRVFYDFLVSPMKKSSVFEKIYLVPDPWQARAIEGQAHFRKVLSLLDKVSEEKFHHALEVGCAEGAFTRLLSTRCRSLLAVDFSETALTRARHNVPDAHVSFQKLDILKHPVPGKFDFIAAMDLMENMFRPWDLKRVRDKLVAALAVDGYFLLVCQKQDSEFEKSWWADLFIRGGVAIRKYTSRHPSLHLVRSETTEHRVYAVFRKTSS